MAKKELEARFWGINRKGEVDDIWHYRKGNTDILERTDPPYQHIVMTGEDPKMELVVVFNFSEIEEVRPFMIGTENEDKIVEELRAKAKAFKKPKP